MKASRLTLIAILVVGAVAAVAYQVRNPEHRDLDAAARQAAGGHSVKLSDGLTYYDVAGPDTGQRVLLAHGFSVPSYIWDSTSKALTEAGFRVARYDYYGRGYSDRPNVDYTPDLFDRQLLELLDSLGWRDKVDIVGLSMGGPVTATFAGRHPGRVRTLTLVDPAAGPEGTVETMFKIPGVGPFLWQVLAVPGMADGQLSDFYEPARWPGWPDRYRVQMQYRGFGHALLSTRQHYLAAVSYDSIYARVGAAGIPTLLIWGTDDHTVPISYAPSVRKAIPQAKYYAIEKAGHLPHMERTDVVNPLLIEFLRNRG
jgi:pimeloyl-ACP methyl ester carboxylesterase